MAVTLLDYIRWDNTGTEPTASNAAYVVSEQPIAETDNWFNYQSVVAMQAIIDDTITRFNANTILKADTNDSPAALDVPVNTMVGRTTGTISALSATQIRTLINVSNGADISIFEDIGTLIREKSGYNRDFVVGSTQLGDSGNPVHDSRMWFDKSSSAFRAGFCNGTEWDSANVGNYSFVTGYCNIASGQSSVALGQRLLSSGFGALATGAYCDATGDYSSAGGQRSVAYLRGSRVIANGRFSVDGDAQLSDVVVRRATTDGSMRVLYLDGLGARVILPDNRTWGFTVMVAARQTGGTAGNVGDSAVYKIEGGIKRSGASTVLIGTPITTVIGEDQSGWHATASADNANEALQILVTGESNKDIDWVGRISLVEVG